MVSFNNVTFKRKSKEVLKDFSLTVKRGERVCLFGPSGCGKTTVLRLIAGLEKTSSGEIKVGGKISFAFQEHRLCPHITILQNLMLVTERCQKATQILDSLGILSEADKKPAHLSGGQLQRASIARALCAECDILLLDEPFNAIDEQNIKKMCEQILTLCGDRTIIMVSHLRSHAEMLGAKIIDM